MKFLGVNGVNTPLFDALKGFLADQPALFCMPGHKGRPVTPALEAGMGLDVTELGPTGNLYAGGDAIEKAEALWGEAWGYPRCQFLTGGATQGLHAALLLCARRGNTVLADRASHRAVHHGLALWGLSPVWLPRAQDAPLSPRAVEEGLKSCPEARTVCITSPTYYGVLSDVKAIGEICRRYGAALVVDAAHGAHLPFLGENPFLGADLVVTSPHKTLPVYGQGAVLFAGEETAPGALRWAAAVTGTSSPSYPVMASLDGARAWMLEGEGRARYREAVDFVARCRKELSALREGRLDPARLVLRTGVPGQGFLAQGELEAAGVWPEMADRDHVVCILTGCESGADRERLFEAAAASGRFCRAEETAGDRLAPPPVPEVVLSPREALFAGRRRVRLREAEGAAAAEMVCPYPPGVPVLAPGERVTKKALAYLEQIGYNVDIPLDICWPLDAIEEGRL